MQVFPALFDWVAYPITILIKKLFENEMKRIKENTTPCPFRLELVAALERILCFCHTGNTAVLATSLMNPLGLSMGVIKDGFPMLHKIFRQPTIMSAMKHGFEINPRKWPTKDGHPAIASKRAQVLTYSVEHFMVSTFSTAWIVAYILLQGYQASLRIDYALNVVTSERYEDNSPLIITKGLNICKIAFDAFFEDTKRLVAAGVRADIAHRKATASSHQEFLQVSTRGASRERLLVSWLKSKSPLSFGVEDGDETFKVLVEAISADDHAAAYGLPNWDEFGTTRRNFAESLFSISRPKGALSPKAPVVRNGMFLPVLKIAHKALLRIGMAEDDQDEFVVEILTKSIKDLEIKFFPASKSQSGRAGAPNRKPVWNSWGHLGHMEKMVDSKMKERRVRSQGTVPPATVAFNNAVATDSNAEWMGNSLNLKTLKSVLRKTSLPKDFARPSLAHVEYVDETYRWVREHYDGRKALHHLALLVGIIVGSSLVPNVFMPTGLKGEFTKAATPEEVRAKFDEMDWLSKSKKGMSDRTIFIAMFTTFIIAIYEKESPLRKHMDGSKRHGLGDQWTAKHSEYFKITIGWELTDMGISAVKGVTYNNLIRLGMAWGKGTGAYEKGTFNQTWGCLTEEEIRVLYKAVCDKLEEVPFGPFDTLTLLIGEKNARLFCRKDRLDHPCRPATVGRVGP